VYCLGLWVDDLPAAVAWRTAQRMGFTPGGIRHGAVGHDVCFFHPKGDICVPLSGEGMLIRAGPGTPEVVARIGR